MVEKSYKCRKCDEELLLSENNFNRQLVLKCPGCGFELVIEDKK